MSICPKCGKERAGSVGASKPGGGKPMSRAHGGGFAQPSSESSYTATTWDTAYPGKTNSVMAEFVSRFSSALHTFVPNQESYRSLAAKIKARFPDPTTVLKQFPLEETPPREESNIDFFSPGYATEASLQRVGLRFREVPAGQPMELFPVPTAVMFWTWVREQINQ